MGWLKHLFLLCCCFNFEIESVHVRGDCNTNCDPRSRWHSLPRKLQVYSAYARKTRSCNLLCVMELTFYFLAATLLPMTVLLQVFITTWLDCAQIITRQAVRWPVECRPGNIKNVSVNLRGFSPPMPCHRFRWQLWKCTPCLVR